MISLLYTIALIILLVAMVDILIHNSSYAKMIDKFPGPRLLPIIGNGLDFLHGPNAAFNFTRSTIKLFKSNIRVWGLNEPLICLIDPDDIEIVLTSPKLVEKNYVYEFFKPWLGEGLFTSKGEKWQKRRKTIAATVNSNILKDLHSVFIRESENLIQKLKPEVDQPETDIEPYMGKAVLNIICESTMGINLDSTKDGGESYLYTIRTFGECFSYRMMRIWYHSDFLYNMSNVGKSQRKVVETLHAFTDEVIEKRRTYRRESGIENNNESKRTSLLDVFLDAEADGTIDEAGVREEVDTVMFGGHDTTNFSLTFTLMLLANNPKSQDIAYKEIYDILNGSDREFSYDDLNNMKYIERCIQESLRLYPIAPMIGKKALKNIHLTNNYIIPAETNLAILIYDVHRNENIYPNPEKFDPDRFLPENTQNRHPFAYIPFGGGPRNCIGQKFAMLEQKTIVSSILRNYQLSPVTRPEDLIFNIDMLLRSINPIKVKFDPRRE